MRLRSGSGLAPAVRGSPPATREPTWLRRSLYRLAVSPGSRALRGLPAHSGRVDSAAARPRRAPTPGGWPPRRASRSRTTRRTQTSASRATGVRAEVLPVLRELNPGAEREHRRDAGRADRGGRAPRPGGARGARSGGRGSRGRRDPGGRARRLGARPSPPGAAGACRARRWPARAARAPARRADHAARRPSRGGRGRPRGRRTGDLRARADPLRGRLRDRRGARACRPPNPRQLPLRAVGGAARRSSAGPSIPTGPDLATLDADALGERAGRPRVARRATGCGRSGMSGTKSPAGPVRRSRRPPVAPSQPAGGDRRRPRGLGCGRRGVRGLPARARGPRGRGAHGPCPRLAFAR